MYVIEEVNPLKRSRRTQIILLIVLFLVGKAGDRRMKQKLSFLS